jgi:hypothetical protein
MGNAMTISFTVFGGAGAFVPSECALENHPRNIDTLGSFPGATGGVL